MTSRRAEMVSTTGSGQRLSRHVFGEGAFEILSLGLLAGAGEEAQVRVYFAWKDANQVERYQAIDEGYFNGGYQPYVLENRPVVVGPGKLIIDAFHSAAFAHRATVVYRRLIP